MSLAETLQIAHIIRSSPEPGEGVVFMAVQTQFMCFHSDIFRKENRRGKKKNLMKGFVDIFF